MILEINTEKRTIRIVKAKEMETFNVTEISELLIYLGETLIKSMPVQISDSDIDSLHKGSIN